MTGHEVRAAGPRDATPAQPIYGKQRESETSNLWMITCNEGWRSSIVATGMYEWAADWLLEVLGRQPFAPGRRP